MRLEALKKQYYLMSDEEKRAIVLRARDNKFRVKPAKQRHVQQEEAVQEKKKATSRKASLTKTIAQLTPEQKAELIRSLQK